MPTQTEAPLLPDDTHGFFLLFSRTFGLTVLLLDPGNLDLPILDDALLVDFLRLRGLTIRSGPAGFLNLGILNLLSILHFYILYKSYLLFRNSVKEFLANLDRAKH